MFVFLLIISIFTIKNTNASSVANRYYTSNFVYGGFTATNFQKNNNFAKVDVQPNNNSYISSIRIDITNDLYIPQFANNFTLPFSITNLTNNSKKLTCTGQQETQTTFNFAFQTTYTDGTTSQNDGVINQGLSHPTFCNEWQVNDLNDYSINVNYILDDNYRMNCQIVNTGESYNVLCPIDRTKATGQRKVSYIQFLLTRKETDNNTKLRFEIGENLSFDIDEEYQIYNKIIDIYNLLNDNKSIQQQIQNNTNEIKNDIKNDNVSGASSAADDLKNNSAFNDSTGLSGIISMPLTIVNSFSNTCQPISLNFPYFGEFELPCLQSVISSKIPGVVSILKIVINGFLIYRVMLDIFAIVRSARNPDEDRIEVLDL